MFGILGHGLVSVTILRPDCAVAPVGDEIDVSSPRTSTSGVHGIQLGAMSRDRSPTLRHVPTTNRVRDDVDIFMFVHDAPLRSRLDGGVSRRQRCRRLGRSCRCRPRRWSVN